MFLKALTMLPPWSTGGDVQIFYEHVSLFLSVSLSKVKGVLFLFLTETITSLSLLN